MKNAGVLWVIIIILFVSVVVLFFRMHKLNTQSVALKASAPGLGEYMTMIQLHTGKLWFAAKAANWELASYELDELKETMEAAENLREEKNGVKISPALDSVVKTQVAALEETLRAKHAAKFQKAYDETLAACNGCHADAGYKFIHIVRPSAPPVTNQRWEPEPQKKKS